MSSGNCSKCEGALVISCDELPVESVILQILGKEDLPEPVCCSTINGYPWSFDTKYYSAEIYLYALKEKEELNSELSESIRAVIFYFDDTKCTSFDEVINWIPYLKSVQAEVQLLIYNNLTEGSDDLSVAAQRKKNVLNWCVKNQFELIELNSVSGSDDEGEGSVKDVRGYERVVQSLQSHLWANLVMKDIKYTEKTTEKKQEVAYLKEISGNSQIDGGAFDHLVGGAHYLENIASECASKNIASKEPTVKSEEGELEDQWLTNVLNGEDPGGESFEALFSKFASLKEKAAGLSEEERKKHAEKVSRNVAIAFWRAMGGDDDEIEGLDDD